MSFESTTIKPSQDFNWSDTTKAKTEFEAMKAVFRVTLKDKSWAMKQEERTLFKPQALREAPPQSSHAAYARWLDDKDKHNERTRRYQLDILYAGNCLRACLRYPSMARAEVDRELDRPSAVDGESAIEVNFEAAWQLLIDKYSPNSSSDIDTMRGNLQAMNDKGPDCFHGYKRDYLTAAGILGDKVALAEHRDWTFKGITCEEICQNVTIPLRMRYLKK
jgi:hypothetical protein